jgi:hypothetical protein
MRTIDLSNRLNTAIVFHVNIINLGRGTCQNWS